MIRAIFIFLLFAAIIFAAQWLLDRPGEIAISWQGIEIKESFAWGVAMLSIFTIAVVIAFMVAILLVRSPWTVAKKRSQSKNDKGQQAISLGMVAVAAGDAGEARRQAKRAAQLAPDQPLATLLAAQSAQLDGDENAAQGYFTKLAETPGTAFLGLRGLWMQAMKEGRTRDALHYIERANEEQPDANWVLDAQLTLQARLGQWEAAAETLEALAKRKHMTAEQARKARACVNVERSRQALANGDTAGALAAAQVAFKAAPSMIPAAAQLALAQIANKRRGKAEKTIQDAWRTRPHPMLADAFRGVVDTVSEDKQLELARGLAQLKRDSAESRIMVARFAMQAEKWDDAEGALAPLASSAPSVRICHLMAEIAATGRGDAEAARDWLARAGSAQPDEAWVCSESGAVQAEWSAVCRDSQLFGTLEWRVPYHLDLQAPVSLPAIESGAANAVAGSSAKVPVVVEATAEPVAESERKTIEPKADDAAKSDGEKAA